jgi:PilZ domain
LDLSPPLVKASKSNRRYPRIPTPKGVWVSWQHDGEQKVSRVRDLNIGGLFIENNTPPPVGTSITLLFSVPEGEIRSSALVRNVTPGEGMGVQFIAMSQEHAVRLQTLFTRLLRSSNESTA